MIPDEAAEADSHWGCMTCSAGSNSPVTNRQAEIAAANHASQGGHPTAYAKAATA